MCKRAILKVEAKVVKVGLVSVPLRLTALQNSLLGFDFIITSNQTIKNTYVKLKTIILFSLKHLMKGMMLPPFSHVHNNLFI